MNGLCRPLPPRNMATLLMFVVTLGLALTVVPCTDSLMDTPQRPGLDSRCS